MKLVHLTNCCCAASLAQMHGGSCMDLSMGAQGGARGSRLQLSAFASIHKGMPRFKLVCRIALSAFSYPPATALIDYSFFAVFRIVAAAPMFLTICMKWFWSPCVCITIGCTSYLIAVRSCSAWTPSFLVKVNEDAHPVESNQPHAVRSDVQWLTLGFHLNQILDGSAPRTSPLAPGGWRS
jgi:hypothetical protein